MSDPTLATDHPKAVDPHRVKGTPENEDWKRKIERRAQSIMISLIVALIVWVGNTLVELKVNSAKTAEHLGNVDVQLSGAYRASDAKRDMADLSSRMSATEALMTQHTTLIEMSTKRIQELEDQRKIDRVRARAVAAPGPATPHG